MIWTMELASYLDDAPWPATKEELVDYAIRTGAPVEVVENLQELEDSEEPYESMEEMWPDYPTGEAPHVREAAREQAEVWSAETHRHPERLSLTHHEVGT